MPEAVDHLVLFVHIVAVCAWLGANLTQLFLGRSADAAPVEARVWWAESATRLVRTYYNVAGVLIVATGLTMVILSDDPGGYTFASTFVSIGLGAVIIGGALGVAVFGPRNRELAGAIRDGDSATESRVRRVIAQFAVLDTLVVAATILAMIWKIGAKYKGIG